MVAATQSLTTKYGIDAVDHETRLKWVGLTDDDLPLIKASAEYLEPDADDIAREFYDHSFTFASFSAKVTESGSNRQTLEGAQKAYFLEMIEGRVDNAHFERALFIGENHTRLDVKPRWNLGNYSTYAQLIFPRLAEHLEGEELVNTILAFQKLMTLDGSLAIEAYNGGLMDRMVDVESRLGSTATALVDGSGQVDTATKEIAEAIAQIAKGANEQTEAMAGAQQEMQQLSDFVTQIATGAGQQTAGVEKANAASSEVKIALEEVSTAATAAAEKSKESTEAAENGMRSVNQTVEAMETINQAVVATTGQIEELNASGKEIGAFTQTISEIADQTNLLALNAAIEAARAGEMGRGFAVVADEVRSLAERASSSAKDIAVLVEKVQAGMDESAQSMAAVVQDVEKGAEKARDAGTVLESIVEASGELSQNVSQIEHSTSTADTASTTLAAVIEQVGGLAQENNDLSVKMRERSDSVSERLTGASSIAEQSAASSEQVSASVEQVSAQATEMAGQSEGLSNVATELREFLTWIGAIDASQAAAA